MDKVFELLKQQETKTERLLLLTRLILIIILLIGDIYFILIGEKGKLADPLIIPKIFYLVFVFYFYSEFKKRTAKFWEILSLAFVDILFVVLHLPYIYTQESLFTLPAFLMTLLMSLGVNRTHIAPTLVYFLGNIGIVAYGVIRFDFQFNLAVILISFPLVVLIFFYYNLFNTRKMLYKANQHDIVKGLNLELSKAKAYFEGIFQNAPMAIFILDKDGVFIDHNQAVNRLFDYPEGKTAIGRKMISDNNVTDSAMIQLVKQILYEGLPYGEVKAYKHKSFISQKSRIVNVGMSQLLRNGKLMGAIGILDDVTDKVLQSIELENALDHLKQTQDQLLLSEKMASLGQLVAGIAHEINNPVNFISSGVYTLTERFSEIVSLLNKYKELEDNKEIDIVAFIEEIQNLKNKIYFDDTIDDVKNLLSAITEGTERTGKIVRDLKQFTRSKPNEVKSIDINKYIDSTLNLLHNYCKHDIEIIKNYGDLPLIECHPDQINQVYMNILSNAIQSIKDKGRVTIETKKNGNYLITQITDTGMGIPKKNLIKIFDPFFTTKDVGDGTGLGLSISYEIIKAHRGDIHVESEVGKGSTFTIKLPIKAD